MAIYSELSIAKKRKLGYFQLTANSRKKRKNDYLQVIITGYLIIVLQYHSYKAALNFFYAFCIICSYISKLSKDNPDWEIYQ